MWARVPLWEFAAPDGHTCGTATLADGCPAPERAVERGRLRSETAASIREMVGAGVPQAVADELSELLLAAGPSLPAVRRRAAGGQATSGPRTAGADAR